MRGHNNNQEGGDHECYVHDEVAESQGEDLAWGKFINQKGK